MDPITMALVAGAEFILKGVATEAVKDAYKGLKGLLEGKLATLPILEVEPGEETYRKATETELRRKGLADDPAVLNKASELVQLIEHEPPQRLTAVGIDIGELRAVGDIIVNRLKAAGDVRVKDVQSGGKIDIQGISAGVLGEEGKK
jgi:hypothetical protein